MGLMPIIWNLNFAIYQRPDGLRMLDPHRLCQIGEGYARSFDFIGKVFGNRDVFHLRVL